MTPKFEFYHVDAFEAPNYEPIWRALRDLGAEANLVAVPGAGNTAQRGWFDFDRLAAYYQERGVPFAQVDDPTAAGITTQNDEILRRYARPHFRLMYGPLFFPDAWGLGRQSVDPFDFVLVHGAAYQRAFAAWKPAERVRVIGYPRYDDFFAGRLDLARHRQAWGLKSGRPTLVYVPTWGENSTWEQFFPAIAELQADFNVLVRPHHCTLRMEPERMRQLAAAGLRPLDNAYDLPAVLAVGDVILSDSRSGVLSEALITNRQTIGLVAHDRDWDGWIRGSELPAITPFCRRPSELRDAIRRQLDAPAIGNARAAWAEQHCAHRDGTAARRAAEEILRAVTPRERPRPVTPAGPAPRVSVVLPTYNHRKFLPLAIESVLAQTFTSFELIVVNDGSTDGTAEYLDGLKHPRIRVIHQDNGRLPRALNTGFAAARGELLTWTSADNYCAPHFLESLVAALDAHPDAGMAVSSFAFVDAEGHILRIHTQQEINAATLLPLNVGIAAFLYRRSLRDQLGEYRPDLEGAEDWDMWLRVAEKAPIVRVPEILYYYRTHAESMTQQIPAKIRRASAQVVQDALARREQKLALDALYPALPECADRDQAEIDACSDFGTRLLSSPYVPPMLAASFLNQAFERRPNLENLVNLSYAFGRAGRWDELSHCLQHMRRIKNPALAPICDHLAAAARERRPDLVRLSRLQRPRVESSELLRRTRARQLVYSPTRAITTRPPPNRPRAASPLAAPNAARQAEAEFLRLTEAIERAMAAEDYPAALAVIDQALALRPQQEQVLMVFGFVLFKLGDHANAEKVFLGVTRVYPKNADAYLNLHSVYLATGRPAEAERALRDGLEPTAFHSALVQRLLADALAAGNPAALQALTSQLLTEAPNKLAIHQALARSQLAAGNLAAALAACIDALGSLPAAK